MTVKSVYTSTDEEYQALRGGTGLVDYDGVGLFSVSGAGAMAFLGHAATRRADFLLEGQIATALLLRDNGTVLAEILVHCRGQEYLVEVWPAQAKAAGEQLSAAAKGHDGVTVEDIADRWRVYGVEGPESFKAAQKFLDFPVSSMAYRSFVQTEHEGVELLISRTGVTGEYGFKLHVPAEHADKLREELIGLGAREVGLDAVDICRMEMRFANLEREAAGDDVTPFDVGLQWMVDMDQDFVGAQALRDQWCDDAAREARRVPVCWQGEEGARDVPGAGAEVSVSDGAVGEVAHAVYSPKLDRVIGMARMDRPVAASGLEFTIGDATVHTVSAPFLVATSFSVPME
jgi:aminomethyltransferase